MAVKKIHEAERYAYDIVNGKILACELMILCCKRYFNDLQQALDKGWYFDQKAALKEIVFLEMMKHTEGEWAGKQFLLEPWQKFFIWQLYGWKKADGTRRFRYAHLGIARKNGKSTFAAAIGNSMLVDVTEPRAQIYSAAVDRDQAKIVWGHAKAMVENTSLSKICKCYANAIVFEHLGSSFKPLSKETKNKDGFNPHCTIIDEYHAHPTSEINDLCESAYGSRRQPLHIWISTKGFNRTSPYYALFATHEKVLRGIINDDSTLIQVYELDKDDDWEDPANWLKCSPNLGGAVKIDYMQDRYQKAKNQPSKQPEFKVKNLNIWSDTMATWIDNDKIIACKTKLTREEFDRSLHGYEFNGGLDLASVRDITCYCRLFDVMGKKKALFRFYLPEETVAEETNVNRELYKQWAAEGWLTLTPGNVVDHDFIVADILKGSEPYRHVKSAYDRWNATDTVIDLMADGYAMNAFGQGFLSMNAPTKKLEAIILAADFEYDGNPIVPWMFSNVQLLTDPAGNTKPDKGKSTNKIDGVVALVMALGQQMIDAADTDSISGWDGTIGSV